MQSAQTLWVAQLVRDGAVPVTALVGAVEQQRTSRPPVGEIAVTSGILTDAQAREVLRAQAGSRCRFIETAVKLGFVSHQQGDDVLKRQVDSSQDLADLLCESGAVSRDVLLSSPPPARPDSPSSKRRPPEWRASQSLAMAIASMARLEPFSEIVQKALARLETPGTDPSEVAALLEGDPAAATALLRLANSALYRRGHPCATLTEAASRLGLRALSDLVVGLSVLRLVDRPDRTAIALREHSAAVGAVARSLSSVAHPQLRDRAFLTGLLHDVGKLLLDRSGEIDYETINPLDKHEPDRMHFREMAKLGYDHTIIGELALKFWQLPEPVAAAVGSHHDPLRLETLDDEARALASLVRLADRLEYAMRDNLYFTAALGEELLASGDSEAAGIPPDHIEEMWPELIAARSEAMGLLRTI